MLRRFSLSTVFVAVGIFAFSAFNVVNAEVCISRDEKDLYVQLSQQRMQNGLPEVPLSVSLSQVAQAHVNDLATYEPHNAAASCNLHSWSANGNWNPVCYDGSASSYSGMWNKPSEVTNGVYSEYGYEIAYMYTPKAYAFQAVDAWMASPSHKPVILEQAPWDGRDWPAMGVGMKDEFVVAWFGDGTDPQGLVTCAVPDFDYVLNNTPNSVSFVNDSFQADSYLWDFGDGTTSTDTSPTHVYETEGNFDVTLTATNSTGSYTYTVANVISVVSQDPQPWGTATSMSVNDMFMGDFNADGNEDIVYSTTDLDDNPNIANDLAWYLVKSNGSGFDAPVLMDSSYGVATDNFYVADMTGDGRSDILISTTRDDVNKDVANDLSWYLMVSYGSGFANGGNINTSYGVDTDKYYIADVNGDFQDDVVISTTRINFNGTAGDNDLAWYLMRSNGVSFNDGGRINDSFGLDQDIYRVGDFNSDFKIDLYVGTTRTNNNNKYDWFLMRSNGSNFQDGGKVGTGIGPSGSEIMVSDVNKDYKGDLVYLTGDDIYVSMNSGSGFGSTALQSTFEAGTALDYLFGDVNGDGKSDVVKVTESGGQFNWSVVLLNL